MKQFNTKLVQSMLIIACMIFLSNRFANAQGMGFLLPVDKRYVSTVGYNAGETNPSDSVTWLWSKNGEPIFKEVYSWTNGVRELTITGAIISDSGNAIVSESTYVSDPGTITHNEESFNENGYPDQMKTTMLIDEVEFMSTVMTFQYWFGANNRLDSTMETTTSTSRLFGDNASTAKTKFSGYNADGRATIIETTNFDSDGNVTGYTKETDTFSKDGSGKLVQEVDETLSYDVTGSTMIGSDKLIIYYDAKERAFRDESYAGTAEGINADYSSYTLYHYDIGTGIKNTPILARQAIVYSTGDELSINSLKAETINIYSLQGMLISVNNKPAGAIQLPITNLPEGIYIVKGSSGWTKKFKK